ncbi:MAG: hypothetical protein J6S11_06545 [Bacteroidaceae bacterium]|nr:hypothetical protein [Bacteroidaceae bacterium]
MKAYAFILTLLSIIAMESNAQTRSVQFTYDNAGNRTGRAIVLALVQTRSVIAAKRL